ncbi:ATP-binding cassette domain-containing protein [Vibrio sp.]|nr:ATP-binding cassette domain-containing protein [Vibrio sp.]
MNPLLEFSNLSKTILDGTKERVLWSDLNGKLNSGEMLALTGFSGSGKSTLLNTLSGIDSDYRGRIVALGTDYSTSKSRDISVLRANNFGYVFQSFGLISFLNVFENVALGLSRINPQLSATDKEKIFNALRKVGLQKHVKKDVRSLSGGEQQRVGIARAIVSEPKILFADEPTANLDSRIGAEIISLIDDIRTSIGMAIIIATHQYELVQHSDQHLSLGI